MSIARRSFIVRTVDYIYTFILCLVANQVTEFYTLLHVISLIVVLLLYCCQIIINDKTVTDKNHTLLVFIANDSVTG